MTFDTSEARRRLHETEPDPSANHLATPPTLDVARDVTQRRHHVLDAICAREEATQRRRQSELEDREGFLQPLAQTGGSVGMSGALEPTGERLHLPARGGRAARP